MEPDAVQRENKPLECRFILRRCSYSTLSVFGNHNLSLPRQVPLTQPYIYFPNAPRFAMIMALI